VPVLWIQGSDDQLMPPAGARETAAIPESDPGSRPSASSGRPEPVEGPIPNPEPDDDDTSHD